MSDQNSPSYEVFDHSGDTQIKAWGRDCLEAYVNASLGLLNQIVTVDKLDEAEECSISVSGDDQTDRCVAFLNELLFLIYTKHWIPKRVRLLRECNQTGCSELKAVLVGEPLDPSRHEIKYDIKAVTYHDFRIEHSPGQVTISFVCDL